MTLETRSTQPGHVAHVGEVGLQSVGVVVVQRQTPARVQRVAGRVAGQLGGHIEHLLALGHGQLNAFAVQLAVPQGKEGDEDGVEKDKAEDTLRGE